MKNAVSPKTSAELDRKIEELEKQGDWRGKTLAHVRTVIHEADPEIVEEQKWAKASNPSGVPVFYHEGIVCTLEIYKTAVKLTFAKGASIEDPSHLFNASLDGNARRAIDIQQGDKLNEKAFKELIRSAVALNVDAKPRARKAE
ncbi:DUF1801 domain-containing protein [Occallatibacter savannae]|uniref:DUF1801 domain-containing protein n=1 Tax=Occallatibacter savannae TaxID=1002691 RepID=UPI000D689A2C|nr:DUF1801 domain-containing protein [Occallatibacter savannae]